MSRSANGSRLPSPGGRSHIESSHDRFRVNGGSPLGILPSHSGGHFSIGRCRINGSFSVGGVDMVGKRRPYIKKPLNAYMLFMKEMRQRVIEECTLKESAAINQILGRKVRSF